MPINTESKSYIAGKPMRYLVDALWGDTPSMREAGTELLPARSGDYDEDGVTVNQNYITRISENTLVNYYKPAVQNMSSKVFSKPIIFGEEMGKLQGWLDDIDLCGCNINDFSIDYFESSIRHGVSFVLVDAPADDNSPNLAAQIENNVRPYLTLVTADQLIGFRHERINNVDQPVNIRISEKYTHYSETDKYSEEIKTQIREIELNHEIVEVDGVHKYKATGGCTWRVWREIADDKARRADQKDASGNGGMQIAESGEYKIDEIPLVPLYTNKTGELQGETYFKTLAYLNLAHWQSSSYQTNILNVVRVPRMYGWGLDKETAEQLKQHGAKHGIFSTQDKNVGELGWLEAKGDSIQHGERDIAAKEEHMAILSLDPILKKAVSTQVATIATIENQKASSILENWANSLERSLYRITELMLLMAGEQAKVKITVNNDFEIISDVAERVKELRELRISREISRETFLEMLKRVTFLDEEFDIQKEIERLKEEESLDDPLDIDELN